MYSCCLLLKGIIDAMTQITGATGYLGAHIVQQALEAGYLVRM